MSNNAHELSNRLLNALDSNYNVVDMQAVNEIISILEKFNITKELLETTRLGKHVNELRRKTAEPTLARRAKVLVKRWRDLVIPSVTSPAHTGSNRSSAERQTRRAGGTPLTSPALVRQGLSPAVPSPRPPSRPAWGGYESDSQDVILVDDDPPPPPLPPPAPLPAHKPTTPPVKRAATTEPLSDDKKAKRDKKLRKRRGHGRAGLGIETTTPAPPGPPPTPGLPVPGTNTWPTRNGSAPERRKNGWRRDAPDPYAALVNRLPPAGAKKVKTTKELLEQIQSRGKASPSRSGSPASPASPDVMLIEPDECPVKVETPLRNGGREPTPVRVWPLVPLEDEKEWAPCICDPELEPDESCPANSRTTIHPAHVVAIHHAYVPGVNGTRAPLHPHKFAVRPSINPEDPNLFASVVPLYQYSDYADDYCVKNMARIPICKHLPSDEFAPSPPSPPPRPPPPSPRPYPIDDVKEEPSDCNEDVCESEERSDLKEELSDLKTESSEIKEESSDVNKESNNVNKESNDVNIESNDLNNELSDLNKEPSDLKEEISDVKEVSDCKVESMDMDVDNVDINEDVNERLKPPPSPEESEQRIEETKEVKEEPEQKFSVTSPGHRTVERTKELDGRTLYETCVSCINSVPYTYGQASAAPVLTFPTEDVLGSVDRALDSVDTERGQLGRPARATDFAEWHECALLGDLIALPYVVID